MRSAGGPPPTPTVYEGIRMRSRAEARWAARFDDLGVQWKYESEGYQLQHCWYLPDFWLPQLECFAEVKGAIEQWDIECEVKARDLVRETGKPLIICPDEQGDAATLQTLVRDMTLPDGYEIYDCDFRESVLRGRLWLDKRHVYTPQ